MQMMACDLAMLVVEQKKRGVQVADHSKDVVQR